MNNLREITQKFKTDRNLGVFEAEQMKRRFSFRVGGTTPVLIEPLTEDAFLSALNTLEAEKVPYFILGGGTNIVFSDQGFDGVVISTLKLNKIERIAVSGDEYLLKAQCGVQINTLVQYAVKNGYEGLEAFSGLPGTCGGGCYMNARCFDLEVSNVAQKIEYFAFEKASSCSSAYEKKVMDFNASDWAYKKSPFTDTKDVVLSVEYKVKKIPDEQIPSLVKTAEGFMKQRVEKGHFKFPCAGSVFKNNRAFGKPTGQIIDELGLKGYSIGGAQIAPWHGNIIINRENATSEDIKKLVEYIKVQVREKTGFELEEEIIFK